MHVSSALKRLGVVVLAIAAFAGCLSGEGDGSAVVERRTVGDTTIVRTIAGSVWGDTARLVEELRIGAPDGPAELSFASVNELTVGPDGSVHLYDEQASAVRSFDSTGAFLRTIGREGEGPGEFSGLRALQALPDGRVALLDARAVRFYSPIGEAMQAVRIAFPSRPNADLSLAIDSAGNLYALTRGSPPSTERSDDRSPGPTRGDVVVRVDSSGGITDTLPVPTRPQVEWRPMLFGPEWSWTFHPHGHFVVGSSAEYAFELRYRDGRVLRVERVVEPVPVDPGERASLRASLAGMSLMMPAPNGVTAMVSGDHLAIAEVKPAYRKLTAADDGRIWVHRHTRATRVETPPDPSQPNPREVWREPSVYDLFEADGRYVGAVAVPPKATLHVMAGHHVWGVLFGENDEQYVVRWRMERRRGTTGG